MLRNSNDLEVAGTLLERYLSYDATREEDLPEMGITPEQAEEALAAVRSCGRRKRGGR